MPHLDRLTPDITVVQECAKPETESDQCLWFGDNPRQGLAVRASGSYRLRALEQVPDVPPYVVPVEVTGPNSFTLFAIWSKKHPEYPYVEGIVRAVELYRDLIASGPTVLIGDFNSNAIWDSEHPPSRCHSALVAALGELGLESAYHTHHSEQHGAESRPTYYFHWNEAKPFHIDYCFLPRVWLARLEHVEVANFADWAALSDHRPLVVDVREPGMLANSEA